MRRFVIAGNWKMNKTPSETKAFLEALKPVVAGKDNCDIVCCVPATNLAVAVETVKGSNIKIGAQNVHFEKSGAFTGEISADMLVDLGVEYVIIGHSERRQYFGETDETVNKRVRAALDSGLTVILCVGELLDERKKGVTMEVVRSQTKIALQGVSAEELDKIIIAYEPVWAIGTGETATAEQANEVNHAIREVLGEIFCPKCASRVTIRYGGSMNAANAAELLAQVDVDGGLIGGASLEFLEGLELPGIACLEDK